MATGAAVSGVIQGALDHRAHFRTEGVGQGGGRPQLVVRGVFSYQPWFERAAAVARAGQDLRVYDGVGAGLMAAQAGLVAHSHERLGVAGLAVILEKRVGPGERPRRPLLVRIDLSLRQPDCPDQRYQQANQEYAQTQTPGHVAPTEHRCFERKDTRARVVLMLLAGDGDNRALVFTPLERQPIVPEGRHGAARHAEIDPLC